MKNILHVLLIIIPSLLFAQLSVVSTLPVNNAVNVPLTATISVTFSEAVDTIEMNREDIFFSNIDWDNMVSTSWSVDLKTSTSIVNLQPNTSYFLALTYGKALSGATMNIPFVYYFTTGASFPAYSVSGSVLSGTTGVSPEHAIVGLMTTSILNGDNEGPPAFTGFTVVNSNGTFTVPHVPNGTYWPLAAKDADGDGTIDPENQIDVLAFGDSIVVNNQSVTNVSLTFINFKPLTYHQAVPIADSIANIHLPADKVLRYVNSWGVDTLGRGVGTWHFVYTGRNNTVVYDVPGSQFEGGVDSMMDAGSLNNALSYKPLTNYALAAPSPSVIVNVDNAGGREYRYSTHPDTVKFDMEMTLGDQTNGWFYNQIPDTNKMYWFVRYILELNQDPWVADGRYYLCDFSTGAVLLSRSMAVQNSPVVPLTFDLLQNYPNPFNPMTTMTFSVPHDGRTRLTVYNAIGQEVATVFDDIAVSGMYHQVTFDGSKLSSGLYIARLTYNGMQRMKKMMLVK